MTDQGELEALFKQHYRRMYRLATILLHDDVESKDVVHDIFARLLDDYRDLREETAESYLLTSVRNRCLNVIRSRQIQERVDFASVVLLGLASEDLITFPLLLIALTPSNPLDFTSLKNEGMYSLYVAT